MAKAKPPDLFTGQSYNLGGPMKSHCLWSCFDFVSSIDCMRHVPHTCICLFSHKLMKFEHLEYDKITLTLMTNEPMKISQIQVFTSTVIFFFWYIQQNWFTAQYHFVSFHNPEDSTWYFLFMPNNNSFLINIHSESPCFTMWLVIWIQLETSFYKYLKYVHVYIIIYIITIFKHVFDNYHLMFY